MDKNICNFGKNLRQIIFERHLKQKEIAKYAGVTEQSVSQIVNGKRNPSAMTALKIADYLGFDIREMLEERK